MNSLVTWIDDRTGIATAITRCASRLVPARSRWSSVWPSMIVFAFAVELITGMALWMYYSASAQTAWESVYYIEHEVAGGWLLRALHHYAGQLLVGLIGVYLIWMIASAGYRKPREFVFWMAVLMGLSSLGLLLTGDLLSWDQNSFWATQVRVKFLTLVPWIGGDLFKLAAGGPAFGHHTLTRFFALHAGVFSGVFLILLVVHQKLLRRAEAAELAQAGQVDRYWPNQALRHGIGWFAVILVIGLLIAQHSYRATANTTHPAGETLGIGLGAPADPADAYAAARPEWAFLGLYELAHLFPGDAIPGLGVSWKFVPIFVIPTCLVLFVLAIPLIGKTRLGHWLNIAATAALLVGTIGLSAMTLAADRANASHQQALAESAEAAHRAIELAQAPSGIPVTGALTLLRTDPKVQGPKLFRQHCASCHDYLDDQGKGIRAEESSAPNLYAFASEQWITGFLDRKQISGPRYFGNTAFKDGEMVDFVNSTLKELLDDEELQEEFPKMVKALAAESKRGPDSTKVDEDTVFLFEDFTCTDCHKFHTSGSLGAAPDLTGYGSRDWLVGIISNPAHKRFYRDNNDRMPAYAENADSPENNILTADQIGMLADWLRGEWYRPRPSGELQTSATSGPAEPASEQAGGEAPRR